MIIIYIIVALFICSLTWVFGFKKLIVSLVAYSLTLCLCEYFANAFFDLSLGEAFKYLARGNGRPGPSGLVALAFIGLPIYFTHFLINLWLKDKE